MPPCGILDANTMGNPEYRSLKLSKAELIEKTIEFSDSRTPPFF